MRGSTNLLISQSRILSPHCFPSSLLADSGRNSNRQFAEDRNNGGRFRGIIVYLSIDFVVTEDLEMRLAGEGEGREEVQD